MPSSTAARPAALRRRDGRVRRGPHLHGRLPVFGRRRRRGHSIATATAGPTCIIAAASTPAALYRNESTLGGALRFVKVADPATDLTAVIGAYPLDVDGDGDGRPRGPADTARTSLLRGLGDCRFERANEAWGMAGGDAITTAFSATWEGPASLPTLAFGNYVADADDPGSGPPVRRRRADPAGRRRPTLRRPDPADAVLVHAVDAVQRLGSVRATGPSGQQRPPLLQRPERRPGAALADRAGRGTPPVHGGGRLGAGPDPGHGHRQL